MEPLCWDISWLFVPSNLKLGGCSGDKDLVARFSEIKAILFTCMQREGEILANVKLERSPSQHKVPGSVTRLLSCLWSGELHNISFVNSLLPEMLLSILFLMAKSVFPLGLCKLGDNKIVWTVYERTVITKYIFMSSVVLLYVSTLDEWNLSFLLISSWVKTCSILTVPIPWLSPLAEQAQWGRSMAFSGSGWVGSASGTGWAVGSPRWLG